MEKEPKMRKHWPPQTCPRPSGYPAPQGLGRSLTRQLSMECGNVLYSYECRMMAWVMIGILFLGKGVEGRAQELSANPFGLESTSNRFSEAGSPFGRESINNPFSEVGSPFSVRGVDNPFGTGVKLETSDPLDRELGLDKDALSWEGLTEAAAQKTKELVEESAKESAQLDLERAARLERLAHQIQLLDQHNNEPKNDLKDFEHDLRINK